MTLFILSFVAGILTVAAPCVLPLLPVIVGGSIAREGTDEKNNWYRPIIIAGSLALSVIIFTLLLKASTTLLGVPQVTWQIIAGVIVTLFGLNLLFPVAWEKFSARSGIYNTSNKLLGKSYTRKGIVGDALIGLSLGPVFSSCSPTYALIVATVLPVSFFRGLLYLIAYAIGLAGMLLVIAYAGRAVVAKLGWLTNPNGWFKRVVAILFIVVGVGVIFGFDKKIQAFVLERGWYDPISDIERSLDR